jgi:hypothetical protein
MLGALLLQKLAVVSLLVPVHLFDHPFDDPFQVPEILFFLYLLRTRTLTYIFVHTTIHTTP